MEYTTLGSTGTTVSKICLGCMSFGDSDWREWVLDERRRGKAIVERALELGVNFFDTANMYSNGESERVLGEALEGHREESVVATKAYFQMAESNPNSGGLSRKAIEQELEHSLDRLGMETIDLYQLHRWDDDTPIEETLAALDDAVRRGKVRHVGASSMGPPVRRGAAHERPRGVRAVRHHAEPLQPRLPRGGARDPPALSEGGDRRDAVESAGARVPHAPARGRGRRSAERPKSTSTNTPTARAAGWRSTSASPNWPTRRA